MRTPISTSSRARRSVGRLADDAGTRAAPRSGRATARARVALLVGDPDRRGDRARSPATRRSSSAAPGWATGCAVARARGGRDRCDSRRPGACGTLTTAHTSALDRGPARSSVEAARQSPRTGASSFAGRPTTTTSASYAALRAYRGDVVIHIGEPDEGATGSVRFHRELAPELDAGRGARPARTGRASRPLMVYRRNPRRQPHVERDRCFECRRFIPTGAIGRCDSCFERRPPALALRSGKHRIEYPQDVVDAMPPRCARRSRRARTGFQSRPPPSRCRGCSDIERATPHFASVSMRTETMLCR